MDMAAEKSQKTITVGKVRKSVKRVDDVYDRQKATRSNVLLPSTRFYFQRFADRNESFIADSHDGQDRAGRCCVLHERIETALKEKYDSQSSILSSQLGSPTHKLAQAMLIFPIQVLISICDAKYQQKQIGHGQIGQ